MAEIALAPESPAAAAAAPVASALPVDDNAVDSDHNASYLSDDAEELDANSQPQTGMLGPELPEANGTACNSVWREVSELLAQDDMEEVNFDEFDNGIDDESVFHATDKTLYNSSKQRVYARDCTPMKNISMNPFEKSFMTSVLNPYVPSNEDLSPRNMNVDLCGLVVCALVAAKIHELPHGWLRAVTALKPKDHAIAQRAQRLEEVGRFVQKVLSYNRVCAHPIKQGSFKQRKLPLYTADKLLTLVTSITGILKKKIDPEGTEYGHAAEIEDLNEMKYARALLDLLETFDSQKTAWEGRIRDPSGSTTRAKQKQDLVQEASAWLMSGGSSRSEKRRPPSVSGDDATSDSAGVNTSTPRPSTKRRKTTYEAMAEKAQYQAQEAASSVDATKLKEEEATKRAQIDADARIKLAEIQAATQAKTAELQAESQAKAAETAALMQEKMMKTLLDFMKQNSQK